MKGKGKEKEKVMKKELIAEDWCFVCKDGGHVRICDYKECLKSYHPRCVGKGNSFLDSENHWTCDWHTCFLCCRSSNLHCYTCTIAVCHRCFPHSDFSQVKGKNGFCSYCLKLALLIEENKDYDSEGEHVDFKDRETYEGLFMEYYLIIKEKEGLESGNIYAAKNRVQLRKKYKTGSVSEEFVGADDTEEEQNSDCGDMDYGKKCKRTCKEKRSVRDKPAKQSHINSKEKEFVGWGSRTLVEFLGSIGKSTSEALSQHDVTSIINEYIKENNLFHSEKRKMIICDARLQPLFRRRLISKYRIYDLLEAHFAENQDESEEDELGYDSENTNAGTLSLSKRHREPDLKKKSTKKEREYDVPQSGFASIVVDNVKLIYLKRSFLYELLKQPESFEEKVIGCFARVKADPYDYCSKNSHQLMQIKGIKTGSIGENNTDIVLLFSSMQKESCISLLSDDDFSEEECEDLRQKVLAGLFMRPTVVELEQKARVLHKDLTKHRINKELALLQKLIDRANEKGWRRELFEYLEKRKRLQTPSEQTRLLEKLPTVIPEIFVLESNSENIIDDVKNDKGSILHCASTVLNDEWLDNKTSEENARHSHAFPPERKQSLGERSVSREPQHGHIPNCEFTTPFQVTSKACLFGREQRMGSEGMHYEQATRKNQETETIEVIELLSDDEDANDSNANSVVTNHKVDNLERKRWCILGPNGEKDKCSLSLLKRWSEISPYASKFKVWKEEQNEENAIWLHEAINIAFPKK